MLAPTTDQTNAPRVQRPRRFEPAHHVNDDVLLAENLERHRIAAGGGDAGDARSRRARTSPGGRAPAASTCRHGSALSNGRSMMASTTCARSPASGLTTSTRSDAGGCRGHRIGDRVERAIRRARRRPAGAREARHVLFVHRRRCCSRRCCRADGSAAASSTRAAVRRPDSGRRAATRSMRQRLGARLEQRLHARVRAA